MNAVRQIQLARQRMAPGIATGRQDSGAVTVPGPHKEERIMAELKALGVNWYGFTKSGIRGIPAVLHDSEHVKGVIYGHHDAGQAALVVTDHRILFIDNKPFFKNIEELPFSVVGGITYGKAGLSATVTLHTPVNDYRIRTTNWTSAKHFIDFIESKCLEV